jgi:hypothetical protein
MLLQQHAQVQIEHGNRAIELKCFLPGITHFMASRCARLTDGATQSIARNLKRLEFSSFTDCAGVSAQAIQQLQQVFKDAQIEY